MSIGPVSIRCHKNEPSRSRTLPTAPSPVTTHYAVQVSLCPRLPERYAELTLRDWVAGAAIFGAEYDPLASREQGSSGSGSWLGSCFAGKCAVWQNTDQRTMETF